MKIALFDFDGTLIDNTNLMSFSEDETFDWVTFMEKSRECCTFENVHNEMQRLQRNGYVCIICTARPEEFGEHTMADLIARNLGEDIVVMRSKELCDAERAELEGITDPIAIGAIIHKHHALYRQHVIEDMEDNFGVGCVKYAFDDQEKNLATFLYAGVKCFKVDGNGTCDAYPF